ncbi:MAG: Asp-tRNA(Asn)/Glu-tRNA(Gln) amidotransferase subunit GatA, partial [Bacteroidota bacterium]
QTSCEKQVEYYLERIKSSQHLNAFVEVFSEEALSKAKEIDSKIKNGTAGKLAGMVIGIKDNISYKNHRTEACSNMLKDFKPVYTATALQRLIDEDVIVIGRLNCDEFAMGGSNEHSAYGPALNPHNNEYVTGGSSGGSAAAVAAGLCDAALGSDTGGSVRQPASFCGIYGLKPTYGRISRYGLIAFGSSFDQIGTLTRCTDDAAILLELMAGHDKNDGTSANKKAERYSESSSEKKRFRIAVIRQCLESNGLDQEVKSAFLKFIDELKSEGHTINMIDFPLLKQMVPAYYILTTAEASSNLSRYSGLLYGKRTKIPGNLDETISNSRSEGFGKEVKRRILLGTFVLSSGFYDAYYEKAQRVRRKILDETCKIYEENDLLLSPATPSTAFKKGAKQDPVAMYLEDIFTVHANLAGMPAMAFPSGKHSNSLPFGFQVMSNRFEEATILDFVRIKQESVTLI